MLQTCGGHSVAQAAPPACSIVCVAFPPSLQTCPRCPPHPVLPCAARATRPAPGAHWQLKSRCCAPMQHGSGSLTLSPASGGVQRRAWMAARGLLCPPAASWAGRGSFRSPTTLPPALANMAAQSGRGGRPSSARTASPCVPATASSCLSSASWPCKRRPSHPVHSLPYFLWAAHGVPCISGGKW